MKKELYSWAQGVVSPAVAGVAAYLTVYWLAVHSDLKESDIIGTAVVVFLATLWRTLIWIEKLWKRRKHKDV